MEINKTPNIVAVIILLVIWYKLAGIDCLREVLSMGKEIFVINQLETPDLDAYQYSAFRVGFMKAILLSLLEQKKLTQAQYESCVKKIRQKYGCSSRQ